MDTLLPARHALAAELTHAVAKRDRDRVEAAARYLCATGMPVADLYDAMLKGVGTPDGFLSPGAGAYDVQEFLRDLVARLRPHRPGPGRGQVVVAVPDGLRHVLGMGPLYHLVEDLDFRVVPVGQLPLHQLPDLVAGLEDPVGVLVSVHEPTTIPSLASAVTALRTRMPGLQVLITGAVAAHQRELLNGVDAHGVYATPQQLVELLDEAANPLSPRERAVLTCVAAGMSNPEAGQHLGVAAATVKTHLDRANAKLGTSDRTSAVVHALRRGWID